MQFTPAEIETQILEHEGVIVELSMLHETQFDAAYMDMFPEPVGGGAGVSEVLARIQSFYAAHGHIVDRTIVNLKAMRYIREGVASGVSTPS